MKVLMSAYACEPNRGSEPGVGWNFARELSKYHDVWVLTRSNNRDAIESSLRDEEHNINFVYFDLPRWARWWKRGQRGVRLYYYVWQLCVYFVAKRMHRRVQFDLAHHVTFVRYWTPSFLSFLPIPFVWGPVGGGESMPTCFLKSLSTRGKIFEVMRSAARWAGRRDPFVRATARRSAVAIATTPETARELGCLGARYVLTSSEAGISDRDLARLAPTPPVSSSGVRFVSVGRLVHVKGFGLALHAFHIAAVSGSEYWIIGDGPERSRLEEIAKSLGLADQVRFWGMLPREQTLRLITECDVLLHPSLHDSGGWTCLEAMAAGLPVICLDIGGPGTQVTSETGVTIPACAVQQTIESMAQAMIRVGSSAELRTLMGSAGRKRVIEEYSWTRKGKQISDLYESCVKGARR